MDRRTFLKTGSVAAGLTAASSAAPAFALRPDGGPFVEVMVPLTRLGQNRPAAADRRDLIGLSARRRTGPFHRPAPGARLVLSSPWSGPTCTRVEVERDNDRVAELCAALSARFSALANLDLQPRFAARELARCVGEASMRGGTLYLDSGDIRRNIRAYDPVFETAEALGVPLHVAPKGAAEWGWSSTVSEAFVASGCFHRFSALSVVIDQVDDELAGTLARIDARLADQARTHRLRPSQQLRRSVFFTTSGLNYHPALREIVRLMGSDRVLYASDRPFAYDQAAVAAAMPLPGQDVERIMGGNAAPLFNLI